MPRGGAKSVATNVVCQKKQNTKILLGRSGRRKSGRWTNGKGGGGENEGERGGKVSINTIDKKKPSLHQHSNRFPVDHCTKESEKGQRKTGMRKRAKEVWGLPRIVL